MPRGLGFAPVSTAYPDLELGRRRGEFDRSPIIFADRRYLVARIRALGIGTQMENDVETGSATAHLLRLDGISIEFCFVSKHAHRCIDVARISVAHAALQLQEHVFAPSGIFLAEYFSIDCGLPV